MKIHKIEYGKDDCTMQEFAASDAAASARMTALKKELGDKLQGKPTREPVEIPTDKAGLIEWLNKNARIVEG